MRILVLTQYFFPHTGGSQEYIAQLYNQLISDHPEVEVDLICYNTDKAAKREKYGNINVYRVGCLELLPGQFSLPNYFELIDILRELKKHHSYDAVNSHTRFFDNSWYAPLIAKYFSAVSVLTDHCAGHPVHQNMIISTLSQWIDAALVRVVPKFYDRVTVVSKATGEFLKKFSGVDYSVFYSGVNPVFLETQSDKPQSKKGEQVVTFLGRMIPSKNPEALLKAAQEVLTTASGVRFVFAGSGPEYDRLKQFQSEKIKFLGKISAQKAAGLLQSTNILVHPSYHHEGLPITLLEAGASGCAVIASNVGATSEVIVDKTTGLIVEDASALPKTISALLSNTDLQEKLGHSLKEKVLTNFNWSKTARAYYSFLQTLS